MDNNADLEKAVQALKILDEITTRSENLDETKAYLRGFISILKLKID